VNAIIGITFVAAAPAAWLYFRSRHGAETVADKRGNRKPEGKTADTRTRRRYKAASVAPGEDCCGAVAALKDQRFLLEEVPRLPLEACDRVGGCQCTYRNFADRRSGDDRRNIYGSLSGSGGMGMSGANHRSGMDRRAFMDGELDDLEFLN